MITYKFKLYSSKRTKHLDSNILLANKVYNHFIALHKMYYKLFKSFSSKYSLMKHLTKLKRKDKYKHWNNLNSQSLQNIIERIDFGYRKFFKRENKRPPSFRSFRKAKSFALKQTGHKIFDDNAISIQGRKFKFWKSRDIEGSIKQVTVKKDSLGDFFVCITTDHEVPLVRKFATGKTAGFDFGLKSFLTSSDGDHIQSPEYFKKELSLRRKLSKKLSKKKLYSNNWKKHKKTLSRLDRKIRNSRLDWICKLANSLCSDYDYIFLEDLDIKSMSKHWGRKVHDVAFSKFVSILTSIAIKYSAEVVKVGRYFPSSKLCSNCGNINKDLKLHERKWKCENCNHLHDRDVNAAINIKREGASSLGSGKIRRAHERAFSV